MLAVITGPDRREPIKPAGQTALIGRRARENTTSTPEELLRVAVLNGADSQSRWQLSDPSATKLCGARPFSNESMA